LVKLSDSLVCASRLSSKLTSSRLEHRPKLETTPVLWLQRPEERVDHQLIIKFGIARRLQVSSLSGFDLGPSVEVEGALIESVEGWI
jgi:hypothetical protein